MSEVTLKEFFETKIHNLKEYFETKLTALKELYDQILSLHQIAIKKAEDAINIRLEIMNEFRAAMKDQANLFITRKEMERIEDNIKTINKWKDAQEGKASQSSVFWAYAISGISLLFGIISLTLRLIGK